MKKRIKWKRVPGGQSGFVPRDLGNYLVFPWEGGYKLFRFDSYKAQNPKDKGLFGTMDEAKTAAEAIEAR